MKMTMRSKAARTNRTKKTSGPVLPTNKATLERLKEIGITEDAEKKLVEFWTAGYTQNVAGNTTVNRQHYHEQFHKALEEDKEAKYHITLEAEPNNKYDSNAIKIKASLQADKTSDGPVSFRNIDLGYVPKALTISLHNSMHRFTKIQIVYTKDNVHDKYWNTRIGCWYSKDKAPLKPFPKVQGAARFRKVNKFL